MRTLIVLFVTSQLLLPECVLAQTDGDQSMSMELRNAISIADKEINRSSWPHPDLELVIAKRYATPWNDVVPKQPNDSYTSGLFEKLRQKTYWEMYYANKTGGLGGDVAIFVDQRTLEVLAIYRGK